MIHDRAERGRAALTSRRGIAVALALLALAGCGGSASPPAASNTLAAVPDYAGHPTIDGIPCETTERVTYHVHSHLAVFEDGQPRVVPAGIGIGAPRQVQNTSEGPFVGSGGCFYWLHTHTADGVIHVEGPVPQAFRLSQFFDLWQQPLTASQVASAAGQVVAYVNGQRYAGDPRDIELAAHAVIQLDVGQDVPPRPYTFASGL